MSTRSSRSGASRTSSNRPVRSSASRTGSVGSTRRSGSARTPQRTGSTPRVTSVRVGDVARENRSVRAQRAYRSYLSRVIAVLAVLFALAIAGVAVYSSNLFAIEEVTVEGVQHLTGEEMAQLAAVPSGTTLLRVDAQAIEENLLRDAWIESVTVDRDFPHTLNLVVTERQVGATVVISTEEGASSELWAISQDGIWLCPIPDPDSEAAQTISPQIYKDAEQVLRVSGVAYGVTPEVGTVCSDESINNALNIVTNMTTELKDQVKEVSAEAPESATLMLDSNVEIAFGAAEDIRDKERICLQILEENPGKVAYINVRVVSSPTWRAA